MQKCTVMFRFDQRHRRVKRQAVCGTVLDARGTGENPDVGGVDLEPNAGYLEADFHGATGARGARLGMRPAARSWSRKRRSRTRICSI